MRLLLHPSAWKQLTKTFFVVFFGLFSSLSATEEDDEEELVKEFAFTGIPDKHCKVPPGDPQYKEVVNFGKHIGWHVGKKGELTKTTWGKIHYSTKGAHIVPIYPRDGKKP